MNVGYMGRTRILYSSIQRISEELALKPRFIWTSKAEEFYGFTHHEFEKLAQREGCPFLLSPSINDGAAALPIEDVDVIVSMNFINLIPGDFLRRIRFGVLNAHAGNLPRYKGNACPNWAILNGESAVTVSVHEMSADLDSGPIYRQATLPLTASVYIGEVYEWLHRVVPNLFVETLRAIMKGEAPVPQPHIRALRTFPRRPEDSRIIWSAGVSEIARLVRASSRPFGGATCVLNRDPALQVRIFRAAPVSLGYDFLAMDGQILERFGEGFCVSSQNSALLVTDASLNGLDHKQSVAEITGSLRNRLTNAPSSGWGGVGGE